MSNRFKTRFPTRYRVLITGETYDTLTEASRQTLLELARLIREHGDDAEMWEKVRKDFRLTCDGLRERLLDHRD